MALQKEKELPSGVVGNYWKVTWVGLDFAADSADVKVALFKDIAAKNSGKTAIMETSFSLSLSDLGFDKGAHNTNNPIIEIYKHLKKSDDFADAMDV